MSGGHNLAKIVRNWRFVVLAGCGGFVAGVAVFVACGPDWVVEALTEAPASVAATVMALPFGLGAAAMAGLFVNGRRRVQARLLRAALNNMTQGLCMFDSAARLALVQRTLHRNVSFAPRARAPRVRRCAIS